MTDKWPDDLENGDLVIVVVERRVISATPDELVTWDETYRADDEEILSVFRAPE